MPATGSRLRSEVVAGEVGAVAVVSAITQWCHKSNCSMIIDDDVLDDIVAHGDEFSWRMEKVGKRGRNVLGGKLVWHLGFVHFSANAPPGKEACLAVG